MIKTIILMIYNLFRIAVNKLVCRSAFDVHWLQRISPSCSLKLHGEGRMKVERNCEFAPYCDFEVHGKGSLVIGEKTYFNRYCMISAHDGVKVGKACMFGPGVRIFDNNHMYSREYGVSCDLTTEPIVIGDHTWIGANVVVLKGARIGNNCVIGAGCVVRGVVPDGKVLVCKQEQILL